LFLQAFADFTTKYCVYTHQIALLLVSGKVSRLTW